MTSILKVSEIQDPTNSNTALTIDSSGNVNIPNRLTTGTIPAFRAYSSASGWQSFGNTSENVMPFNSTDFNVGNHYDTTNYKFVAPVSGLYSFYFQWYSDATISDSYLRVGSTDITFSRIRTQGATVTASLIYQLSANDEVKALGRVNSTNADDWYAAPTYSYFEGHLIG